ncbi:MAG TPA: glycosyltransferase family 4 protein [Armatimonadota bacterium]|nr:glycosyltransferase family 4 protein [Armatimonadota bacterium]
MSERAGGRPWRIALYDAYGSLYGAGAVLHRVVTRLDRERFDPIVLLARAGALQDAFADAGVPCEVMPPGGPLSVYGGRLLAAGPIRKLRAAMQLRRYSRRIERWLREREVDLLHCNQARSLLLAGSGARRARVPVVWNVLLRQRLPTWLALLADRAAARIVVNAPDNLDLLPRAGALRAKATHVPNCADTERFSPTVSGEGVRAELGLAPGDPLIVSAGALIERKGHELLVRAAPEIMARFPSARILIVGGPPADGDETFGQRLRELAHRQRMGERIIIPGGRDDMPDLLAACDVFVLASRQEGSPTVVLEAMATGRPVVVTPPAAVVVTDDTGVVVPLDDPAALAGAIIGILADPDRARRMGDAARRHVVEHYGVDVMVRGYERVYEELLGGR